MEEQILLSQRQAAAKIGRSVNTLRDWVEGGLDALEEDPNGSMRWRFDVLQYALQLKSLSPDDAFSALVEKFGISNRTDGAEPADEDDADGGANAIPNDLLKIIEQAHMETIAGLKERIDGRDTTITERDKKIVQLTRDLEQERTQVGQLGEQINTLEKEAVALNTTTQELRTQATNDKEQLREFQDKLETRAEELATLKAESKSELTSAVENMGWMARRRWNKKNSIATSPAEQPTVIDLSKSDNPAEVETDA